MRQCQKDNDKWPWKCSCDDCSRAASASWIGLMNRVYDGDITLEEAYELQNEES